MRTREISNGDDVIDSRDIIRRVKELEGERADLETAITEVEDGEKPENAGEDSDYANHLADAEATLAEWDEDNGDELRALKALADDGENSAEDWQDGATLIRESYFVEYAQQYAEDTGAIDKSAGWPATCIDWEQAADQLRQDYSEVDYDGVAYLVRC